MIEKLKIFFKESRQELKRVNWPTKQQTARYTMFVIWLSLGVAVFLGILDFGFLQILQKVILQ